ncbi:MAG: LysM peptidoglycan-binding domain-containing protein [Anaerolineales bacterium]|nr:LysM peptidoglycan-binding domain-containing protein [Anaerolineales bacterium]
MPARIKLRCLFGLILLVFMLQPVIRADARPPLASQQQASQVSAYDLIIAMNTLRMSYGLPALIEHPIVNAVAQGTAEIMAANQMSWHIGNVAGRLASAGYGGGAKVWATENFAVGYTHSIDTIMVAWSDASHMLPAVNPAYCHVGAGVAKAANGMTYYVLQAAYVSGQACGAYSPPGGTAPQPGDSEGQVSQPIVPQIIVPVKIATPDERGRIYHEVQPGQSLWAIAVTYKITIRDLEIWNNISRDTRLRIGQRLFIPGSNTEGYLTPTPVGMVKTSTPDPNGKIVHVVQSHQMLSTIARAYGVSVDTILRLNGLQVDWILRIDQELVIDPGHVTPSPTPRPLTPIERLTPDADGNYYHTVSTGENLSFIASLYQVPLNQLLSWNNLNQNSIIRPEQKLILQVTPPATETATPSPVTVTLTASGFSPTTTPTQTPVEEDTSLTSMTETTPTNDSNGLDWWLIIGFAAGSFFLAALYTHSRRKQQPEQ